MESLGHSSLPPIALARQDGEEASPGKSVAEAHRMLSNTYGEADISERTYREWCQPFKNGDFDVEDQHGIWWDQLGVVYYELLKPTETITGDRYRAQLLNHKCIISFLQ
ncbi:uncharacterized protein TNCV_1618011 [Trichonephila clavipes]|nr:uncharacterized protein TNCV_1618011 [Trichonephila clavipes]